MARFLAIAAVLVVECSILSYCDTQPRIPPNTVRPLSKHELARHPRLHRHHTREKRATFVPPVAFDARHQWPKCASIGTIWNQGQCGTCWAVSTASVLSDRLCIASNMTITDFVSPWQVAGCTNLGRSASDNCNAGDNPANAYYAAAVSGFASGGPYAASYNATSGCVPYDVSSNGAPGIACAAACSNRYFTARTLPVDTSRHIVDSYWIDYYDYNMNQTEINASVLQMQQDIFTNGPITATIQIYSDFASWRSASGPYAGPGPNTYNTGGHAIRIIGWNQTAAGVPYWLIANSWGTSWADLGGYFWLKRGSNVIEIEQSPSAPVVNLTTTVVCNASTFCSSPIDQAIRMDLTGGNSTIFLFQGQCLLQVTLNPTTGQLTRAGSAVPIGERILNVPTGNIITYDMFVDGLSLMTSQGQAGVQCIKVSATKYGCSTATWDVTPAAQSVTPMTGSGSTIYNYYNSQTAWMWYGNSNTYADNGYSGSYIGTLFSATIMQTVKAFLDIDGKRMLVFGVDGNGKQLIGVMTYPQNGASSPFTWATQPASGSSLLTC